MAQVLPACWPGAVFSLTRSRSTVGRHPCWTARSWIFCRPSPAADRAGCAPSRRSPWVIRYRRACPPPLTMCESYRLSAAARICRPQAVRYLPGGPQCPNHLPKGSPLRTTHPILGPRPAIRVNPHPGRATIPHHPPDLQRGTSRARRRGTNKARRRGTSRGRHPVTSRARHPVTNKAHRDRAPTGRHPVTHRSPDTDHRRELRPVTVSRPGTDHRRAPRARRVATVRSRGPTRRRRVRHQSPALTYPRSASPAGG